MFKLNNVVLLGNFIEIESYHIMVMKIINFSIVSESLIL